MIQSVERHSPAPAADLQARGPCSHCLLGCHALAVAAPNFPGLANARPVHGRNLLRVVSLLFGLPLVALTVAVCLLQASQVTAQPLLSLALLAGLGCVVFGLVKANGDKLLHALQPHQRRNEVVGNYE